MYAVLKISKPISANETGSTEVYKTFKSEKAAVNCAIKRNKMFMTQVFNQEYVIAKVGE